MSHKVLFCAVLFTMLVGCGSDRDSIPLVPGSNGVASISGDAVVGGTLSASIADPDGVQSGSESYQWYSNGAPITGATSSSYTLTSNEGSQSVTVVVRYTDSPGLRETVESAPQDIQAAFTLGALYFHGLVDGAVCEIAAIDAMGVVGAALASATSGSGSVSFGDLVPVDGAALVSCTGGTYVDEASGTVLDAPDTRAVVDVQGDAVFTVSPLTEIAAQLAETAGDLKAALSTYNEAVGINFGVANDITQTAPTNLATTAANNDDPGRYATALALISQLDANDPGASAGEILTSLSMDLADGTFSQATLDDVNQAVIDLAASPVAGNLDSDALTTVQGAINNLPEPAEFDGLSASIPNDQVAPLNGTVTVTDVNFGEDRVVAQTDVQTTYGTFSIAESGAWTYVLGTMDPVVAGLDVGESVTDIIPLTSVDGTAANLLIRITALTQVAEIRNTINGDTGELRLNLDPHQLQGRLSFSFLKTEALADDGNQKDAYITLYGSSGSSSESLVDLRIQGSATNDDGSARDPRFLVRNTDNAAYPGGIIEAPFTPNEWYDIEIIWDMSQENQITILINGEVLGGGPFSTAAVVDPDFTDLNQWFSEGVERVQWRFGDNGTVIPFGSYFIDNVEIFSDTGGTTLAFMDDFESYNVGESFTGSIDYPDSVDATVAVFDRSADGGATPAAFFNLVGAINSDSTEVLMDMVTVIDPDPGEDMLVEQTNSATTYGTFSILPSGTWEYTLDTTNPTIAAMVQGDRLTDTIQIASVDGTTAELVITINGVGGAPSGGNTNVAVIVDTDASDTGELRYALGGDGPLAQGRVELKIKRLDDDLGDGDAFITLFNSATNNDGAILDFRIRDDSFGIRSPSGIDTSSLPHTLDAFMDVRITWEYPGGATSVNPVVTISVDGVSLPPFTPDNNSVGGVTHVAVRFGDNSGVREATGKVSVDDLAIYSDAAGFAEVFSDDFESYLEGDSLDTDNAASPYNSSTSEATVETIAGAGGPGSPGNKLAEIIDTDSGDTGELRYALGGDGPLAAGRLEVSVKRLDDDLGNGDAFITLFNADTNNAGAILDFRIRDDSFGVRSPSTVDTSSLPHTLDAFMDVLIIWEYPGGDTTLLPTVTISVDGVALAPYTTDNSSFGGVTHVAFRFGDNSGVREATGVFSVDDLGIYADTDGMTRVFADNFESYLEGDSLDTDNAASPYNSSTSEATVAAEAGEASGPGTPGNKIAEIIDTDAGDTGELRYALEADGPLAAGRLNVAVKRLDDSFGDGDAFITLFNGDTNNAGAILDFRIRDDSFGVRNPSSIDTSSLPHTLDAFMNVQVTWEYPGGDTAMLPTVTITVDDVSLAPFIPDNTPFGGVTHIAFRFGDNSGVRAATGIFSIDEIEIFSDTAGTTAVFTDDFESYLDGDSLDTDNAASPYNSSTSEATVGVEE
ncbi:MAG: VCBS domain-containing protein [Pseudomonadota bacterium]